MRTKRRSEAVAKTKGRDTGGVKRQRRHQLARLERRLEALRAMEQRQSAKLARTQERIRSATERFRDLGGSSEPAAAEAPAAPLVMAYCLRERRRVEVSDGIPVTLRNGRAAFAGTCPDCGVRIVALAVRPT
jgi:hypothetical protein